MVHMGIAWLNGKGLVEFDGCEGHDGETEPFESASHGGSVMLGYGGENAAIGFFET